LAQTAGQVAFVPQALTYEGQADLSQMSLRCSFR
jgi:hypothetical protein